MNEPIGGAETVGHDRDRGRGRARVLADAARLGLPIRLLARPAAASLHEAATMMGIEPGDIVKTLVVKRHDGDYLFVLVPGGRKISWSKLRALVGVNRLSLPGEDKALEATGYHRGTITPLGSRAAWPLFADSTLRGREVAMGAGEAGYSAFVDADALLAALNATVADITDPE